MVMIRRLVFGGFIASLVPFALSILHCVYLTVRYADNKSVTQERAARLATTTFPGKQICWLCVQMVALWSLPFIWLKRAFRTKRTKTRELRMPLYTLPPHLRLQLEEWMTKQFAFAAEQ